MNNDTTWPFSFPAACTKKINGAFDGGGPADCGVVLLALRERKLAAGITNRRNPERTIPTLGGHFAM